MSKKNRPGWRRMNDKSPPHAIIRMLAAIMQ